MRYVLMLVTVLLICSPARAEEAGGSEEAKTLSGMSVLGNNEAPKALVIVPWKSSQIGDGIGIVESLSNRPMPIDRDVFGRELEYYLIRTEDILPDDVSPKGFSAR
jgi:hypothetical protein